MDGPLRAPWSMFKGIKHTNVLRLGKYSEHSQARHLTERLGGILQLSLSSLQGIEDLPSA